MPQPGFAALPEGRRGPLIERGRRANRAIADFVREGVKDGSTVPCDAALVTHICAGAFGWLPKWLPGTRTRTRFEIADEICTAFRNGLAP
jgi:hypothetical protein